MLNLKSLASIPVLKVLSPSRLRQPLGIVEPRARVAHLQDLVREEQKGGEANMSNEVNAVDLMRARKAQTDQVLSNHQKELDIMAATLNSVSKPTVKEPIQSDSNPPEKQ